MVQAGKIDGRTRYWVYTGNKKENSKSGKTIIFGVYYLGQCGGGFGRKVERKIELKETQSLDDLQDAIIFQSFGWDDPHLYSFFMDNKPYTKNIGMEYSCDREQDTFSGERPNSSKVKLRKLNLSVGQKFLFVFDFGDDHHFQITVAGFGEIQKVKKYPAILEVKGKAPVQYPRW